VPTGSVEESTYQGADSIFSVCEGGAVCAADEELLARTAGGGRAFPVKREVLNGFCEWAVNTSAIYSESVVVYA